MRPPHVLSVAAALAWPVAGTIELFLDWSEDPIVVSPPTRPAQGIPWAIAEPVLRERMHDALRPLVMAGWHLDGSASPALRWATTATPRGVSYAGCWVRLRADQ